MNKLWNNNVELSNNDLQRVTTPNNGIGLETSIQAFQPFIYNG